VQKTAPATSQATTHGTSVSPIGTAKNTMSEKPFAMGRKAASIAEAIPVSGGTWPLVLGRTSASGKADAAPSPSLTIVRSAA
jgi:hypothetical protein